jgi:Domain of unknown function (DUF6457)
MTTLQNWIDAAAAELGVRLDEADVRAILDLARITAHQVERPAAPVTSFLVGLAVGAGLPLPEAAGRVRELAASWAAPAGGEPRA